MTELFDKDEIQGRWLTNSKMGRDSYIEFHPSGYFDLSDGRNGSYTIKKDSIYLNYPTLKPKGRLLKQTKDTLLIYWGNTEAIRYIRPR
ncbi:hypothetical protein [Nonlabens marinus]|uniref:hypothetical protein n=1 Tax=Nonlabens marinus TaxID=930802 RepID=UPI00130DBC9F|nr:hypothetical protein [Nonlabens marinus]